MPRILSIAQDRLVVLRSLFLPILSLLSATFIVACSDSTGNNDEPVASVAVAPPSLTITIGSTGTFTSIPSASSGSILTGRTTEWSSSNTNVATVNGGVVTGVGAGSAIITAMVEGKSRSASISVTTGVTQAVFASIAPGSSHTCALTPAGKAYCWGTNEYGQVGTATTFGIFYSPQLVAGNLTFMSITSGSLHSCALTAAGVAYCWGNNGQGQLGDGTTTDRNQPTAVNTSLVFTSIAAAGDGGGGHTCAMTAAGVAYCWGRNGAGQVGDNSTTNRTSPVAVQGGLTFSSVSTGILFSCGLTIGQKAFCWGHHDYIGEGTTIDRAVPTAVAGNITFKKLFASWTGACGITPADAAHCWGFVSGAVPVSTPAAIAGLTFDNMAPGTLGTCGVTLTGAGYCWGANNNGQVGDGTTSTRPLPTAVSGSIVFSRITAGNGHACGVSSGNLAWCWGGNSGGQLGDASQTARVVPTAVRNPL